MAKKGTPAVRSKRRRRPKRRSSRRSHPKKRRPTRRRPKRRPKKRRPTKKAAPAKPAPPPQQPAAGKLDTEAITTAPMGIQVPMKGAKGRPAWYPTPADLLKVQALAAIGLHDNEIAEALGISDKTFIRRKRDFSPFLQAIQKGRLDAKIAMSNVPYSIGLTKGHKDQLKASLAWLRTHGGWRETMQHTTPSGEPIRVDAAGFKLARDKVAEAAEIYARAQARKKH